MTFNDDFTILNISRDSRIARETLDSNSQTIPVTINEKETQSISSINEQVFHHILIYRHKLRLKIFQNH